MNEAHPTFLASRFADGTWTAMLVSEDQISEVQEMTATKLIEIVEALENVNKAQEKDWWTFFD